MNSGCSRVVPCTSTLFFPPNFRVRKRPCVKTSPPSLNLRRFPQRKDESEEKGEAPAAEKDLYDALAPGFDGSLFPSSLFFPSLRLI